MEGVPGRCRDGGGFLHTASTTVSLVSARLAQERESLERIHIPRKPETQTQTSWPWGRASVTGRGPGRPLRGPSLKAALGRPRARFALRRGGPRGASVCGEVPGLGRRSWRSHRAPPSRTIGHGDRPRGGAAAEDGGGASSSRGAAVGGAGSPRDPLLPWPSPPSHPARPARRPPVSRGLLGDHPHVGLLQRRPVPAQVRSHDRPRSPRSPPPPPPLPGPAHPATGSPAPAAGSGSAAARTAGRGCG